MLSTLGSSINTEVTTDSFLDNYWLQKINEACCLCTSIRAIQTIITCCYEIYLWHMCLSCTSSCEFRHIKVCQKRQINRTQEVGVTVSLRASGNVLVSFLLTFSSPGEGTSFPHHTHDSVKRNFLYLRCFFFPARGFLNFAASFKLWPKKKCPHCKKAMVE